MERSHILKGGPSRVVPGPPEPSSNSRWRSLARLIYFLVAAGMAYFVLYQFHVHNGKLPWSLKAPEIYNDEPISEEGVHGSTYLLGVGKADITGSAV
jgi:hypothetical protein